MSNSSTIFQGTLLYCFTSVRLSKIFFVTFFSATIDGRNLIFRHKRHIGIPYRGKCLDPSDSYFLFAGFVDFYTHWTYMLIFRHIFLSNYWWQRSDIWSQASYRYPISWEAFLDPSDSYFLFVDFVDFYTHWTYILYMPTFSRIFLSNYWWQKSDIWSQALYRYPISWEAFFWPVRFLLPVCRRAGYHKWALAHSSSCFILFLESFHRSKEKPFCIVLK